MQKLASALTAKVYVNDLSVSVVPMKRGGIIETSITVRYGSGPAQKVIGRAIIGGRWNEAQGLKEFKKNPKRFKADGVPDRHVRATIYLGPLVVATATLTDVLTEEQVLAAFQKEPFAFIAGEHWDAAQALGLVAA